MTYRRYPASRFRHRAVIALSVALLLALARLVARAETADLPRVDASGPRPVGLLASTTLVVNEIDYDQPGTDGAEFVELKNVSGSPINLGPYELQLVSGDTGTAYKTFDLPDVDLPSGDYFVVCADATTVDNCDLDVSPDTNLIQNGAPDAVAVAHANGIVDTVSYEGDSAGGYTEGSGAGLVDNGSDGREGISRFPDGTDTDQNNVDLSVRCISPGESNLAADSGCEVDTPTPVTGTATNTPDGPTATPGGPTDTPSPATATGTPATSTPMPPTTEPPPSATAGTATSTPVPHSLAVELEYFRARRSDDGVVLMWRTLSEVRNAGFHVWRQRPGGELARITTALLPPTGGELTGADYRFVDRDAPGSALLYFLDDVETTGRATRHGPVPVWPRLVVAPSSPIGRFVPQER